MQVQVNLLHGQEDVGAGVGAGTGAGALHHTIQTAGYAMYPPGN